MYRVRLTFCIECERLWQGQAPGPRIPTQPLPVPTHPISFVPKSGCILYMIGAGEGCYDFVEHAGTPAHCVDADAFIMTMHSAPAVESGDI